MRGRRNLAWPSERVDKLSALLADGYSASQAGAVMGCSRNAIIGIALRKNLVFAGHYKASRSKASRRPATPKRSTPFRPKIRRLTSQGNRLEIVEALAPRCEPVSSDPAEIPMAQRRTLLELRSHDCRWPYGDVGAADFFFCGGPAVEGAPYCTDHCRLSYRRASQREEEAA